MPTKSVSINYCIRGIKERWLKEKEYLFPIPPHYTTSYGERIDITAVQPIMEQNTFGLQHPLSTYEALLMRGDR